MAFLHTLLVLKKEDLIAHWTVAKQKIATLIQLSLISTQWSTKSGKRAMSSISHWRISTLWSGRYNFCWYLKNYTMNQLKGTRFFRVKNVDFFSRNDLSYNIICRPIGLKSATCLLLCDWCWQADQAHHSRDIDGHVRSLARYKHRFFGWTICGISTTAIWNLFK